MALITTSVSSSFAETGSFGYLNILGNINQELTGSSFGTGSFAKIEATAVKILGQTYVAQSSGTSGEVGGSGAAGGTGAGGGTGGAGGTGGTGAIGGQGAGGGTGGTGGAGGTGAGGGTGGTGGAGGTGGTGNTGGAGGTGGTGAIGGQGGTGGTGSGGSQGATGGTGGTGGTGNTGGGGGTGSSGSTGATGGTGSIGGQGGTGGGGGGGGTGGTGGIGSQGGTGPSGTSPMWTSNATLTWSGTKYLRSAGNYVYVARIRNSGGNGWGTVVKSGGTNVQLQNFGGSAILHMYSNGNVSPSPMSDRRSKRNITAFPSHSIVHSGSALSELKKLDGYAKTFQVEQEDTGSWPAALKETEADPNFPWNTYTGYVAQDVMAITGSDFGVSGSVHVNKFVQRIQEDITDVLADDPETFFSFDYHGLTSLKAQATIDLMKEVEGLKTRVQALEG